MNTKLENLLDFTDFTVNFTNIKSNKTKRTDTGLDIIKENVEDADKDYSTVFDDELDNDDI